MSHRRQDDPDEFDGRSQRNSSPGNGPWWSRSVLTLGPLAVGFLMMLAATLGWNPFGDKVEGRTEEHGRIEQALKDHAAQTEVTNRMLRAICRHTAGSDAAKQDCDR